MVTLLNCGMALELRGGWGPHLLTPEIANYFDGGETYDCSTPHTRFFPDKTLDADLPTVTVVVPTSYRRHKYHNLVNHSFFSQIYPAEKLDMLVFDGRDAQRGPDKRAGLTTTPPPEPETSPLADFWMKSGRVRYEYDTDGLTVGAKRNWFIGNARGELIVNFHDDDFYNVLYVRFLVEYLMHHPKAQLVKLAGWYSMMPRVGATSLASNTDRFAVGCYEQPGKGFGFSWAFRSSVTQICQFEDKYGSEENKFLTCMQNNFPRKAIHQIGDSHSQILKMDTCGGITDMVQVAKVEIPISQVVKKYGLQAWDALQQYSLPHIDPAACDQKWKHNFSPDQLAWMTPL